MPFCPECGAEISVDVKFCPDCGAKNVRNSEGVVASPNVPSPQTNNRMKRTAGNPQKYGPVLALVLVLGFVVILLATGSLGNLLLDTSSTGTLSPTPVATQGTVYPSWLKINNWYQDQIVRYVAVKLDTVMLSALSQNNALSPPKQLTLSTLTTFESTT